MISCYPCDESKGSATRDAGGGGGGGVGVWVRVRGGGGSLNFNRRRLRGDAMLGDDLTDLEKWPKG